MEAGLRWGLYSISKELYINEVTNSELSQSKKNLTSVHVKLNAQVVET